MSNKSILEKLHAQIADKDYQTALDLIQTLQNSGCTDSDLYAYQGRIWYEIGNFGEALKCYKNAVNKDAKNNHAWMEYGRVLLDCGSPEEAEYAFKQVKADRSLRDDAFLGLAAALSKQNKTQDAIKTLRKALTNNPQLIEAWFNLAQEMAAIENWEETVRIASRAHYLAPNDLDVFMLLANGLINVNRPQEAKDLFEKLRWPKILPPEFYGTLAEIFKLCGEETRAVDCLIEACANYPESLPLKYNLCLCYEAIGDYEKATQLAELIVSQSDSPRYASQLAQLLLVTGKLDQAWGYYEKRQTNIDFERGLVAQGLTKPAVGPVDIEYLKTKPVVLVEEQGIGDTLFFLRYVKILRANSIDIYLDIGPKLCALTKHAPDLRDLPIWENPRCYPPDVIPLLVGTMPSLFGAMTPEPLRFELNTDHSSEILTATKLDYGAPKIGVTWQAGIVNKGRYKARGNLQKRIEPSQFVELLSKVPGTIVLLQREPVDEDLKVFFTNFKGRVVDCCNFNSNLELMLGLLSHLDNYIGVSNTNMHLRAGLGLSADVLVCNPPEWRWMNAGEMSPWFPKFKLHRPPLRR